MLIILELKVVNQSILVMKDKVIVILMLHAKDLLNVSKDLGLVLFQEFSSILIFLIIKMSVMIHLKQIQYQQILINHSFKLSRTEMLIYKHKLNRCRMKLLTIKLKSMILKLAQEICWKTLKHVK